MKRYEQDLDCDTYQPRNIKKKKIHAVEISKRRLGAKKKRKADQKSQKAAKQPRFAKATLPRRSLYSLLVLVLVLLCFLHFLLAVVVVAVVAVAVAVAVVVVVVVGCC